MSHGRVGHRRHRLRGAGDRLGRVKTLTMTIGLYAAVHRAERPSVGFTDFMLYRFLTAWALAGLRGGGGFAGRDGARQRPALCTGPVSGVVRDGKLLGRADHHVPRARSRKRVCSPADGWLTPWRIMFLIGIIPGILLVVVQFMLQEPEKWKAMRARRRPACGRRRSERSSAP